MSERETPPEPSDNELHRAKRKCGMFVAAALIAAILLLPKIDFTPSSDSSSDADRSSAIADATFSEPALPSAQYRAAAKELVRRQLRDPASATFSDVRVYPPRGNRSAVVCGRVAARNGFGGMNVPQRFIAANQTILEAQVGQDLMNEAWAASCR